MELPSDISLFVPGRLCLLGEHSDWAAQHGLYKGYCLVIGTDQGLNAQARPADRFVVETRLPDPDGRIGDRTRQMSAAWDLPTLTAAAQDQDEFFRYCAGVAAVMFERHGVGGLELRINRMDLPLRKGVSSSAAVCILVAKAFNAVYRLGLLPNELMEIAYQGEKLTGSQCGRMDQACIYGKTPVLLSFARGAMPRVEPVQPGGHIPMFFVDLAGRKDTVRILADLQRDYPGSEDLQRALGPENDRITRAGYRALELGDAAALGELMRESQEVFDACLAPHSPRELAAPLLHELLACHQLAELTWGGKTVGSGGDGTAQFVARDDESRDRAMELISRRWPGMQCFPLNIGD
jgi:galactokinase